MNNDWRRPSALEAARGVIAVLISHETMLSKGASVAYSHDLPYSAAMLERRIARGGLLPFWITEATHE